jgi:parvulin-like peptidyl-prolyl isomerase
MTTESKRRTPPPPPPKRPRRRSGLSDIFSLDSDASSRMLLIGGVVLVLVLAAGFIGYGYYATVIKPRHRTVLGAAGVNISYEAMRRHMLYDVVQNASYLQSQAAVSTLPQAAYDELVDEIILVKRGPSDQGITVSDDDIDTALRARIGVAKDANQQQFATAFRGALSNSKLNEDEYRRMVLADVIKTKIQQKITQALPATLPQAKVAVIQLNTKDDADKALTRLKAGEDFATVAKDVSIEPDKATTGGTHDYQLEGEMNTFYSGFAFSAPVGQLSDVITAGSDQAQTFYIVRVEDRSDKPLTDQQKPGEAQRRYNQWLEDQKGHLSISNHWDQQAQTDALVWVLQNIPAPTAVPAQPTQPASGVTVTAGGTAVAVGTAPAQPPANPQDSGNNPAVPTAPVAPGGGNGQ